MKKKFEKVQNFKRGFLKQRFHSCANFIFYVRYTVSIINEIKNSEFGYIMYEEILFYKH